MLYVTGNVASLTTVPKILSKCNFLLKTVFIMYYQQQHDHPVFQLTAIFHILLILGPKSLSMTLNILQLATTCWAENVTHSDELRINHRLTEVSALSSNIILLNVTPENLLQRTLAGC